MTPFYERDGITIFCGDCLGVMPQLEGPFDAIIADLPYGTTACSWDTVIPFEPLWEQYKRLACGAVVLFGSQPFTSALVMSNVKQYRHWWIWIKEKGTGFQVAKYRPMMRTEDIIAFGGRTFNPQMVRRKRQIKYSYPTIQSKSNPISNYKNKTVISDVKYPENTLFINTETGSHPTQKPVALLAYLIRTYTNPSEIVLDNTMGSGTTLVAAQREGRRAVGIEISEEYCKIAVERLRQPTFWSLPTVAREPEPVQPSLFDEKAPVT